MTADENVLSPLLSYLVLKNWGIVALSRCCVIILVRLPRTIHAISDPSIAFPIPAHVEAMPYFQPNCPAYPTKTTAEKYDVPYAKAVSQGPTLLPPRTKPFTSVECFLQYSPIPSIIPKNIININDFISIISPSDISLSSAPQQVSFRSTFHAKQVFLSCR